VVISREVVVVVVVDVGGESAPHSITYNSKRCWRKCWQAQGRRASGDAPGLALVSERQPAGFKMMTIAQR
jgi:hypothetical protein